MRSLSLMRVLSTQILLLLSLSSQRINRSANAFTIPNKATTTTTLPLHRPNSNPHLPQTTTTTLSMGYTPPEQSPTTPPPPTLPPYPKIGDMSLYYDLDGGSTTGETIVGKITFLQRDTTIPCGWTAEMTPMDPLGEGYYTDYPSRKRRSMRKLVPVDALGPLTPMFVRSEDAWRVPLDSSGAPSPAYGGRYRLDEGFTGGRGELDEEQVGTVEEDGRRYGALKMGLFRDAALAGVAGTALAGLVTGGDVELTLIYAAGALAGVGYLFFLSVKVDAVGEERGRFGDGLSNLRFVLPVALLVGVSLKNLSEGRGGLFRSVTNEQFGAAMLGFLTYRIPLFLSQIAPVVGESAGGLLPGSAGVALDMLQDAKDAKQRVGTTGGADAALGGGEDLTTVLVVSGPSLTGKSGLVERLLEDDGEGRFVRPQLLDKVSDPVVWDRLEGRGDILEVDATGRFGLTKDGVFDAVAGSKTDGDDGDVSKKEEQEKDRVVVLDADVELVKRLTQLPGTRIVGVWVGLDSLDKFETRMKTEIEAGRMVVPTGETEETVIRTKIRDVVRDIEYGLVSGVFEFTILNDDFETSVKELKEAAAYCFK